MDTKPEESCPAAEVLSALHDGELSEERAAAVRTHLAGCPACRAVAGELGALSAGLQALAGVDPGRDLWPGILRARRREVRAERGGWLGGWRRLWLVPAGALAGAGAALLVVFLAGGLGGRPDGRAVEALAAVLEAERTYQDAIAGLEASLAGERPGLPPEVQGTIAQGLLDIDAVIARCREALRDAPDDLAAHRAMLAAYQHKVDFLTELTGESL